MNEFKWEGINHLGGHLIMKNIIEPFAHSMSTLPVRTFLSPSIYTCSTFFLFDQYDAA